jgi:hypothetical protein
VDNNKQIWAWRSEPFQAGNRQRWPSLGICRQHLRTVWILQYTAYRYSLGAHFIGATRLQRLLDVPCVSLVKVAFCPKLPLATQQFRNSPRRTTTQNTNYYDNSCSYINNYALMTALLLSQCYVKSRWESALRRVYHASNLDTAVRSVT